MAKDVTIISTEPGNEAEREFVAGGGELFEVDDGARFGIRHEASDRQPNGFYRAFRFDGQDRVEISQAMNREYALGSVRDNASGASAEYFARFHAWLDEKVSSSPNFERMTLAGYEGSATGGNCTAWIKELDDRTKLMISSDCDIDGDPEKAEWVVGRYEIDGDGIAEVGEWLTLEAAIAVADRLPSPTRSDGTIEMIFPTVDDVIDDGTSVYAMGAAKP